MNKNFNHARIAVFLVSAFIFLGINFGASAQQDAGRQRTIGKPTPQSSPSPRQSPTPTPTVSPTVTPTPVAIQTLADLQSRIKLALSRPELRRGMVGIKVAALDTNKVIYEENAEKYLMPASNMKSFTVAAALERLSPNFRFTTSVLANSQPDASGAIIGDLTVFGRGDVSLSTAFYEGDYYKGLDALADKIVAAGVKRVEGNLIADDSYFSGSAIPASWEWDDLQWYYGAEVSALPLNDNALDLNVKPSSGVGSPCLVQLQPFNAVMRVTNRCTTSAAGTKRDLTIKKDLDQNILVVSGSMPIGDKPFANYLTVSRPAELFAALLRQRLQAKGVVVTGQTRVVDTKEKSIPTNISTTTPPIEIAKLESAPLSLIAAKTMKPSQNMYTETLLWTLGEQGKNFADANTTVTPEANPLFNPKATSSEKGVFVVGNFLREIGVAPDSVIQWDGSGLSRHNLVTPAALVQLYTFMAKQSRNAQAWRDSLPIGGVDGTLQNRFKNTAAERNVRAKTGTIDQVSGLSGYVTTAAGETLVFSIIVNSVNNTRTRTTTIDEIIVHLANFNGRTN
jgi:D-alanyl-D-alanine carboxypeptidase/D-alanyl-D-alanine-endopeptidase (penicillin-binding protein 4)